MNAQARPLQQVTRALGSHQGALVLAVVLVVVGTLALDGERAYLRQPQACLEDIARHTALLGIFALGSAIVIIAGGIDLSAGSVIAFSGTVCAAIMLALAPDELNAARPVGTPVLAAAIAGTLVVGFLIGTLHAWLIATVGLPPFVATLATLVGLRSLGRALAEGVTTAYMPSRSSQIQVYDEQLLSLARNVWVPVALFLAISAVAWVLLNKTVTGRHLYALGGNEEAARLSGIRTDRMKWLAYTIGAMLSSLAGVLYIADQSVADPQTLGRAYELNAIAAAVVGGCSLQGGVGTVTGVMLGCLFLRTVIDGIAKIINTSADTYEGLFVGILVVLAVVLAQWRGMMAARRRFFAGALGVAAIAALSLLASLVVAILWRFSAGVTAGVVALVALIAWQLFERRMARLR